MIMTLANEILTIQQPQAAPRQTIDQSRATAQDLQNAAQDLREEIRNNIQRELNAARDRSSAQTQRGPVPANPAPPALPGQITIRRPDGNNTVISVPPGFRDNIIPPQAVDISIGFFMAVVVIIIGLPLARAFARRMDRRGASAPMSNEIASQLTHLNQAVDAIALEVERISEGQRFTTRLLSEQREAARQTLPSGAER